MQSLALTYGVCLGIGLLLIAQVLFWPREPKSHGGRTLLSRTQQLLDTAGFPQARPWILVLLSLLTGLLSAILALVLLPIIAGVFVAGGVGMLLPTAVVFARARKRVETARVVWPDLLDQLIASLRGGLSLAEGLQALASSGSAIATHFADFGDYYERSHSFERALDRLKVALADPIADRVLEGIRMVREVGGTELIPMLQLINDSLRKENRLRGELMARQSWLMNAARLGAAAPWLVLIILGSRPETAQVYNSSLGTVIILGGLALTIIAYALMSRIARLPEQARWLG